MGMGKISQQTDLKFRKGFFRVTPRLPDSRVKCRNEAREIGEIEDEACFRSCAGAPMLQRSPGAGVGATPAAKGAAGLAQTWDGQAAGGRRLWGVRGNLDGGSRESQWGSADSGPRGVHPVSLVAAGCCGSQPLSPGRAAGRVPLDDVWQGAWVSAFAHCYLVVFLLRPTSPLCDYVSRSRS